MNDEGFEIIKKKNQVCSILKWRIGSDAINK